MTRTCLLAFLWILGKNVIRAEECISRGRFPNQLEKCRGYTMCISGPTGFTEYKLTCPDTFIYSHIENLCTNATSYKCYPEFKCTAVGNFESDNKDNCTAYIACIEGINGMLDARWIACPPGTLFSPNEKSCINETSFDCNKNSNSPNVLSVVFERKPNLSGNFSFNKSSSLKSKFVFVLYLLMLVLIIK